MDLWVQVRHYVLAEGRSKRSACRKFGLNWRTMQKMLEHPEPPGYRRVATPRTRKIDKVMPFLEAMLEADRSAPRKQRHTSRRVYERLRDEHGFDGGLTIVKDAVQSWRKVHAQTYVPLSHPPGEAQVDFGEAAFYLNGVLTKATLFVMSLPPEVAVFVSGGGSTRGNAPSRSRTATSRPLPSSAACRHGSVTTTAASR